MGQWPFGPLAHAGTLAFGQCTWRRLGKCKRVSDGAKRLSELFYISLHSGPSQNVGAREAKLQLESWPIVTKLLLSSKLTAKSKSTSWELVYVNSSQMYHDGQLVYQLPAYK